MPTMPDDCDPIEQPKNCPFCGGPATLATVRIRNMPNNFYVACRQCDSTSSDYARPWQAVRAWNIRTPEPQP